MMERALSEEERVLLRWLLERGGELGQALLPQVDRARVVGRCPCGCASIDLAVDGRPVDESAPEVDVKPDFYWTEPNGALCSVYVFAQGGVLSGLEVWSVDGETTPMSLPSIDQLRLADDLPS